MQMRSQASSERASPSQIPPKMCAVSHQTDSVDYQKERCVSMSSVSIERVRDLDGVKEKLPAFAELEKTIEKIQRRAFSLFEQRGESPGLEWDDWLLAEHDVLGASSAELHENAKELKLRVAVPGTESKDVKVTATPKSFIVQANARNNHSLTDSEIRFSEFSREKLCRQFALPSRIDVTTVSASLDKGILQTIASKARDVGTNGSSAAEQ
jgi:HSP20 family protein